MESIYNMGTQAWRRWVAQNTSKVPETILRVSLLENKDPGLFTANSENGFLFKNSSSVDVFAIDDNGFQLSQYNDVLPSTEFIPAQGAAAPDVTAHTIGNISMNFRSFDGGNTEEAMTANFEVLHGVDIDSLNRTTNPLLAEIHTHGMPSTTGAGVVKIFFDLVYQPVDAAPIVWNTFSTLITIKANQQYFHKLGGVELPKPTGGYNIGDNIIVKYRRTPTDSEDTYAGDWLFKQCAFHLPVNSNGSRLRYKK